MDNPGIASIAGPLVLGYLFNWGLTGALTVQVYLYYLSFPNDTRAAKTLVFGIYAFEFAQSLLAAHDVFESLGSGWGNKDALNSVQLQWLSVPMMSGMISGTVQIFNAWRIHVLSKSIILTLVIVALALTETTAAIIQGVQALRIKDLSKLQDHAFISDATWLGCSALCDVIITISLTYYLTRTVTGFWKTKATISRIIWLSVGAGSLTATIAITDLTLFLVFRNNNDHITPALVLPKLYSNSLLVQLNSRIRILGARDEEFENAMNSFHADLVKEAHRDREMDHEMGLVSRDRGEAAGLGAMHSLWRRTSRSDSRAGFKFRLRRKKHATTKSPTNLNGINVSVSTYRDPEHESIQLKVPESAAFKNQSWDTIPKITSASLENKPIDLQVHEGPAV